MRERIANWWSAVSWYEAFGVPANLACVWLCTRESIWNWPVGILGILLFLVMFFQAKLYSDVVLQVVFLVLSIIGWYEWLKGGPRKTERRITRGLSHRHLLALAGVAVCVQVGAGLYFATQTDAALPYWDSTILALSLVAQWLLNRKAIENWLVWIVVDALAVGVYAARDLYLTSVLYAVFFCFAIRGYLQWRRKLGPVPSVPVPAGSGANAA
jgi:nicotinamide mononucleotide transporter